MVEFEKPTTTTWHLDIQILIDRVFGYNMCSSRVVISGVVILFKYF
jgi:hypothetical protein